jgi:hypothetical protein
MVASVSNTAYGIINDAMHDAGLLGSGDLPNSDQIATNLRRLCDIINLWQTQGLKLFTWTDLSIPLVESQTTYTIGPSQDVDMTKPLRALQGYVLNTDNIRRPIVPLSWRDWMQLSQVSGNDGTISSFFVDKQATYLNVKFWNAPDATEALNTAHLLIQQQAANPVNLEADVSFPQEWRIALRWGLADDICTGQPETIMARCASNAKQYREMLEDWDVEDTETRFTPSTQFSAYNEGSFR